MSLFPMTSRKTLPSSKDRTPPFRGSTLEDKMAEILGQKRFEAYPEDIRRARVYCLMDLYYHGYQNLGPWDDMLGWPSYDAEPLEYMENRFRRNALINAGGLIRMEPSPVLRPASGNLNDVEAAMTAQDAWEKAKEEIGYDALIAEKSLQKVLFGTTFVYSGYRFENTDIILTPKHKMENIELPGAAMCLECGTVGEPGTPTCPQCGLPMEQFAPMQDQTQVVDGYEERQRGELYSTAFSPLEVKIRSKVKGGLRNQPYLLRYFREDVEKLDYLYPDLELTDAKPESPPGYSAPGGEASLRYQGMLAALPGNVWGNAAPYWATTSYYAERDVVVGWVRPSTYRRDPELTKEAPDGLMAVMVAGKVAEWRPEKLDDVWTQEVYFPSAHSAYGDGMFDDAPIQRMINEVGQLTYRHFQYDTIPLRLYDSTMLLEEDFTNDPAKKWVKVSTTLDRGLESAVRELPASTLSFDVNVLRSDLRQVDQDISAATDPLAGQIAGANTPYSAQVLAVEQGQTRFLPSAKANRVSVRDHVRQVLELAKKHWTDPRTMAEIDQNTGRLTWKKFVGTDLSRGNWNVYILDNDFKPKTRGEQMQSLETARAWGIDMVGTPKLRLQLFEKLGIDPSGDTLSTQARRASRIIERITNGEVVAPNALVDDGIIQFAIMQEFLASEQGDDLLATNPQAWQGILLYMQTALTMAAMKNNAFAMMGIQPPQPLAPPGQDGQPPQQGGGPQPQKTEHAQSNQVSDEQKQPMPQSPARQQQGAGTLPK